MLTSKDKLILWYLNYINIDITDREIYDLSIKYDIPMHIFLKKITERLISITSCDYDKIMNILQVDMNLNLSNEAYIFIKDFIQNLDKIDIKNNDSKNIDSIKVIIKLFEKLDIITDNKPHKGQPLPDSDLGRPYISWKQCMHENCKQNFTSGDKLVKHLKEFNVYTPSYHKLHEDIIKEMKLTEESIKTNKITKCPSWICKEQEFTTSLQLIEHFQKLGLEPFWKQGMSFSKSKEYIFDKDKKIYFIKTCPMCMENNTNIIFNKCLHQCYCISCYDTYIKNSNILKCPICRTFNDKIYPS
jgi:hypothetical protein